MINSYDILLISTLSRKKSLVGVARTLNISASAISQRLSALEERLDVKIAERVGRSGIILTSEGQYLAERGAHILNDLAQLNDELAEQKGQISGVLNVFAPLGFGRLHVAPLLGNFLTLYPTLDINLTLSDQLGNIPKVNWDVIIRVEPLRDTTFTMKKLAPNTRILCASPDYIKQYDIPKHPNILLKHQCISISEDNEDVTLWRFRNKVGISKEVRVNAALSCNDGEVALAWALAGKGIILRSEWSVASYIREGSLIPLLVDWTHLEAPVIALTKGPKGRTARVQVLIDYLHQHLKKRW